MAGNVNEFTLEAYLTVHRAYRAGNNGSISPASRRDSFYPFSASSGIGSRLALYVTLDA